MNQSFSAMFVQDFILVLLSLCIGNFCAGTLTTAAFTAMMNLSQGAEQSIQSTHYSLLATVEVSVYSLLATVELSFKSLLVSVELSF